MKLLWVGALLVTGLSFYNPKFILVFSVILLIDLVIDSRKDLLKLVRCLNNKRQLLSLKRINTGLREEINTCYPDISKHNKGKSN